MFKPTGNRHLLRCNKLWDDLLMHYELKDCVVDPAKDIEVFAEPQLPVHSNDSKM